MSSFFLLLFTLLVSTVWGANGFNPNSIKQCSLRKQQRAALIEATTAACVRMRDSQQCQDFYKTLDEEDQKKKRTCQADEIESNVNGNYLGPATLLCAGGIIVDPVVSLGTGIGEGIAKAQIAWEKASECNQSLEQKMAIIMAFNMDAPKLLQYPMLSQEKLKGLSCEAINDSIQMVKRVNATQLAYKLNDRYNNPDERKKLSADELDFMNYYKSDPANRSSGGIEKMAKALLQELNLSLDCYTPAHALAIRCEIAATIAALPIPGLLAARMARLSKLTKIRLGKVQAALDNLRVMGREARIAKATEEIATLSKEAKVAKLQSELGRANKPFNQKELDAYEKAHKVGADKGETFGSYSGASLREKKRILMEEGKIKEVEADFMINRGYVGDPPDAVITAVKESKAWEFVSVPLKRRAGEHFGRTVSDNQAAAIMSYNNAVNLTSGGKEKAIAEALERLKAMGFSDSEIKTIVSGDLEKAKAVASTTTQAAKPSTTATASTKPVDAPKSVSQPAASGSSSAENPFLKKAESNYQNDPVYNLNEAATSKLPSNEVKKLIDKESRTRFAKDEERAEYVTQRFQDSLEEVQKFTTRAKNADLSEADRKTYEALVQVHSKRCRSWASLYNLAGYQNTNIQGFMKDKIRDWCK